MYKRQHYDKGKTIDEENDIRAFFGIFDESPLVGNGKVVIGRIFEINKVDEGGAFLAIYKVFYRDTVLQIVGKGHVLLQQRAGRKVLELVDGLVDSIQRQALIDCLLYTSDAADE